MKPILFNTEMVQAILEGRKTQTRRVIKPKYTNTNIAMRKDKNGWRLVEMQNEVEGETIVKNEDGTTTHKLLAYRELRPPCQVGDILWVRETWQEAAYFDASYYGYKYKADSESAQEAIDELVSWRPSIHMPQKAARLYLKVLNVRVERLQDITPQDCHAEGMMNKTCRICLYDGDCRPQIDCE